MNIYALLHQDHQLVQDLLDQIVDSADEDESRGELFRSAADHLRLHSRAEDDVFYAALAENDDNQEAVSHAEQQHEEIDALVAEIERLDPRDDAWLDKVEQLAELIEEHVDEEEDGMFETARAEFDAARSLKLGEQFNERKEHLASEMRLTR
jgi:hypothetical protein